MIRTTDSDATTVWISDDYRFITVLDKIGSDWTEPGSVLVYYIPDEDGTMDDLPPSGCALLLI
jgi:hypothetical protein